MIGLDQVADVFTENPTTGAYDVTSKTGLECRLAHVDVRPGVSGDQRAELAAIRSMIWEPSYAMPENAQVLVSGTRWQPRPGSFGAFRGPNSELVYRRCDVVRQS